MCALCTAQSAQLFVAHPSRENTHPLTEGKHPGEGLSSENEPLIHKVHKYLEYHSVCPLVRIETPPHPLSRKRVCPPPGTTGGGGETVRTTGVKA
jgi:hypothetical protein